MTDRYFSLVEKNRQQFGKNTIVLWQCGSFHEMYDREDGRYGLKNLAKQLNMHVAKKKLKNEVLQMAGYPKNAATEAKYVNLLIKLDYTVIIVDQLNDGIMEPERNIRTILSPSLAPGFEKNYNSNYLASVLFEEHTCYNTNKKNMIISCIFLDASTGELYTNYFVNAIDDFNKALDELYRILKIYNSSEYLFSIFDKDTFTYDLKYLLNYLELQETKLHFVEYDKIFENIQFQKAFLTELYSNDTTLDIIEYLHFTDKPSCIYPFVNLINFVKNHDPLLLKNLKVPKSIEENNNMILSYNSIYQLDILSNKTEKYAKFNCLFDVLNKCKTSGGKRLLKSKLTRPTTNVEELNKNYNVIENLLIREKDKIIESNNNKESKIEKGKYLYEKIRNELENIGDLSRFHRKLELGRLNPLEFTSLDSSYEYILNLINILTKYKKLNHLIPKTSILSKFNEFIKEYKSIFELENMNFKVFPDMKKSILKIGFNDDIDKLQNKMIYYDDYFKTLSKKLTFYIDSKANYSLISVMNNDRDGYYLQLTKKRKEVLIKNLSNLTEKPVFTVGNKKFKIYKDKLIFKIQSSNVKLTSNEINQFSTNKNDLFLKLYKLSSKTYKEILKSFLKYSKILENISDFVSKLDFLSTAAHLSIIYSYKKPLIKDLNDGKPYFHSKELRHPIIERLLEDKNYIPNDISMGYNIETQEKINGILLYSCNGLGKSSLLKSIALSICMAQAGLYTPCNLVYYPYKSIHTRIDANDNLFKAQSSFQLEIIELRSILKRCDEYSLIVADELSRGTESDSAVSIVAASLKRFVEKNSNVILATHYHNLPDIPAIKSLKMIKIYHLSLEYNKKEDKLIYTRKLQNGKGAGLYGLEIAKSLGIDSNFMKDAYEIRNFLTNNKNTILENNNKSRYNSKLIITNCQVCNKPGVDVHHINFQCSADLNNMIGTIHKNKLSNLVVLCKECHINVHNHTLKINGYIETSKGKELSFENSKEYKEETIKKRKKYSDEQVKQIQNIKDSLLNISQKRQVKIIKKKLNIDISKSTLKKILNNNY